MNVTQRTHLTLVDLVKSFPTSIEYAIHSDFFANSASIKSRTILPNSRKLKDLEGLTLQRGLPLHSRLKATALEV